MTKHLSWVIAFLRQVRYIFRAEILTGQGLVVPHQSRKRYISIYGFKSYPLVKYVPKLAYIQGHVGNSPNTG